MHRAEEQAAAHQLQASEHTQRLQALHVEALNMRQQEVIGVLIVMAVVLTHLLAAAWWGLGRGVTCDIARAAGDPITGE
jgi:hypothetical protein